MCAPVIAHGDPAPVLEPSEHVLYFVALLVEVLIVFVLHLAVFLWRDAGRHTFLDQGISEPISIVAAIRKEFLCYRQSRKQSRSTFVIADLSRRQMKQDRLSLAVDNRMKL